jgi:hypothetical protein
MGVSVSTLSINEKCSTFGKVPKSKMFRMVIVKTLISGP